MTLTFLIFLLVCGGHLIVFITVESITDHKSTSARDHAVLFCSLSFMCPVCFYCNKAIAHKLKIPKWMKPPYIAHAQLSWFVSTLVAVLEILVSWAAVAAALIRLDFGRKTQLNNSEVRSAEFRHFKTRKWTAMGHGDIKSLSYFLLMFLLQIHNLHEKTV